MTRKGFLLLFVGVAAAEQKVEGTENPSTAFAEAYNEWVRVASPNSEAGKIDVAEFMMWPKVKKAWRKLERFVDEYYKQY